MALVADGGDATSRGCHQLGHLHSILGKLSTQNKIPGHSGFSSVKFLSCGEAATSDYSFLEGGWIQRQDNLLWSNPQAVWHAWGQAVARESGGLAVFGSGTEHHQGLGRWETRQTLTGSVRGRRSEERARDPASLWKVLFTNPCAWRHLSLWFTRAESAADVISACPLRVFCWSTVGGGLRWT